MSRNVLCIMGPTGSGKTDLACFLSDKVNCEIVSVDSVLVYKGLDIGSAKPSASVLKKYPHHLVDICDPASNYSVGNFYNDLELLLKQIISRGNLPVLVGGTAMYFNAIQFGMNDLPVSSESTRSALIEKLNLSEDSKQLYNHLETVDPETAKMLVATDKQRIIRALDVYYQAGIPLIELQKHKQNILDYNWHNIILLPPRHDLKVILKERLIEMVKNGLIDEVKDLKKREDLGLSCSSIKSVGYRQAWDYLDGNIDYKEFMDVAFFKTCQLAKRQYTWFKKWPGHKIMSFIGPKERDECLQIVLNLL